MYLFVAQLLLLLGLLTLSTQVLTDMIMHAGMMMHAEA
jgi:hypothetical protein